MGDPGTGKTVSIHKIMMNFLDIPIFWISSDSLINSEKIRAVFRILNMFPGSIFIFDDFLYKKTTLCTNRGFISFLADFKFTVYFLPCESIS